MYDFAILIGRFSAFHNAHFSLLKEALNQAKNVIVVIGSHNKSRSIKNPFTSDEREQMIRSTLNSSELERIKFLRISDKLYNDNLWIIELQEKISRLTNSSESIALIGTEYDKSSFYLKLFPQWTFIPQKNDDNCPHATKIRQLYFSHDLEYKNYVHNNVFMMMEKFKESQSFKDLKDEYNFINEYMENWRGSVFPPTFVTVDAVCIKSGHILLVKRKTQYGKGLLCLPGGFLGQHERVQEAAIKELKEEGGIKISKEEIESHIVETKVFDHPDRSLRGRTITHAIFINLKHGPLPNIRNSSEAIWMPLSEFVASEEKLFEDHFHIVNSFIYLNT